MTPLFARLLADSAAALGHLTATELALVGVELAIEVVALALAGSTLRRSPREILGRAADLDEAA
jgi:hypothetical protein